ncbi:hypothetical protein ACVWW7_006353 [Bradyrhizobium sp. LM6.9]
MSEMLPSRGGAASSCAVVIASSRRSLPEGSLSTGMRARMRRSRPAGGDDDVAARGGAPGRNEIGQQRRQVLDVLQPLLSRRGEAVDALGEQVSERRHVVADHQPLLARLIDDLHERAEADRDQERDDERRHRAAQRRLRDQQPMVGRFRDRLRQSFDRIGLHARVRGVCTRHALGPLETLLRLISKAAPHRFRITAI